MALTPSLISSSLGDLTYEAITFHFAFQLSSPQICHPLKFSKSYNLDYCFIPFATNYKIPQKHIS
jgi:hypothetical protein